MPVRRDRPAPATRAARLRRGRSARPAPCGTRRTDLRPRACADARQEYPWDTEWACRSPQRRPCAPPVRHARHAGASRAGETVSEDWTCGPMVRAAFHVPAALAAGPSTPPLSRDLRDFPPDGGYARRWTPAQAASLSRVSSPERSIGLSVSGAVAPSAPANLERATGLFRRDHLTVQPCPPTQCESTKSPAWPETNGGQWASALSRRGASMPGRASAVSEACRLPCRSRRRSNNRNPHPYAGRER